MSLYCVLTADLKPYFINYPYDMIKIFNHTVVLSIFNIITFNFLFKNIQIIKLIRHAAMTLINNKLFNYKTLEFYY